MTILDHIGNTPLIELEALTRDLNAHIRIKWEGANPTGSMKDRIGWSMIAGAEARGELRRGMTVVEFTGGSTGSSLALVCSVKGYHARFVTSDAIAPEKIATMRAFGAAVEVMHSDVGALTPSLYQAMEARVRELAASPQTFWTHQFENPDNRSSYHAMADEILRDTGGRIDAFVMGVGTGGCFSGNAEILKARVPDIRCIAVEPEGDDIEGLTSGIVGPLMRRDLIDEVISVSDADAADTARRLAREEGIFSGMSAGANVWAARSLAGRLGADARIVTIAPDSGLKYLHGALYR